MYFPLKEFLSGEILTAEFDYLTDMFSRINDLNSSLQSAPTTIFAKLMLLKRNWIFGVGNNNVQKDDIDMFSCLQDLAANASVIKRELYVVLSQHLNNLCISIDKCFPKNADP